MYYRYLVSFSIIAAVFIKDAQGVTSSCSLKFSRKKIGFNQLVTLIQKSLDPDLLKPYWQKKLISHRNFKDIRINLHHYGHCYHATEALFRLMGGKASGLMPHVMRINGQTHWYLKITSEKDKSKFQSDYTFGSYIDITADQFAERPNYDLGKANGMMLSAPSKRSDILISRVTGQM